MLNYLIKYIIHFYNIIINLRYTIILICVTIVINSIGLEIYMETFQLWSAPAELLIFKFLYCAIITLIFSLNKTLTKILLLELNTIATILTKYAFPRLYKNLNILKLRKNYNELPFALTILERAATKNQTALCNVISTCLLFFLQIWIIKHTLLTYDTLIWVLDLSKVDTYKVRYGFLISIQFFVWSCPIHLVWFLLTSRDLFLFGWVVVEGLILTCFGKIGYIIYYTLSWCAIIGILAIFVLYKLDISYALNLLPYSLINICQKDYFYILFIITVIFCIYSLVIVYPVIYVKATIIDNTLFSITGNIKILEQANFDWSISYLSWVATLLYICAVIT